MDVVTAGAQVYVAAGLGQISGSPEFEIQRLRLLPFYPFTSRARAAITRWVVSGWQKEEGI